MEETEGAVIVYVAVAVLELDKVGPVTSYSVARVSGVDLTSVHEKLKQFEANWWLKSEQKDGTEVYEITGYGRIALCGLVFSYVRRCAREC